MALNYLAQGNSGELDYDFNMEVAFPPITPSHKAKRINPVRALDELLRDIIIN
jgi:hypothetical protein